uniref:ribosomal protein S2 n=1 Tax=Sarcophyte sanguinea TaxID=1618143 RepID=UPI0026E30A4B|nr:ribosomal protein S2 [Sarcophyte sanguinea]WJE89104.1 ribosomal protein S2 [Sarcophyte sanguinea]WJE89123.1 ribosomal protein S2 [Sarcophyte sanguinea]
MKKMYWYIDLKQIVKAGIHFGHNAKNWKSQMLPYIYISRKNICVINIITTINFLTKASDLVFNAAKKGKEFLIIGTEKKISNLISRAAIKIRCHYINKKYLVGILTNWYTTKILLYKFRNLKIKQENLKTISTKKFIILRRQLSHLQKFLYGILYMTSLPDVIIGIDYQDKYLFKECTYLKIPIIWLLDTNCDPDFTDIFIPMNDNSIVSIRLILNKLIFSICKGYSNFKK